MLGMYIIYRVEVPNALLQSEALAKSKGVHCEVESERSWRQKFEPTDRNCIIRRRSCGRCCKRNKSPILYGHDQRRYRGYMNGKVLYLS